MADDEGKGWTEHRLLVLSHLDRQEAALKALVEKIERVRTEDIAKIKEDVRLLKFQAGMWGGAVSAAMTAVFALLARFIK